MGTVIVLLPLQDLAFCILQYLTPLTTNPHLQPRTNPYANLLDKLNIKKVAVLGFSAGGPSSIEFVLRHPDKTSVLVLVAAVVHKEPPMGPMDYVIHYGLNWM
jgi:pimeloyl-ACP methyl ester carboxylesterase